MAIRWRLDGRLPGNEFVCLAVQNRYKTCNASVFQNQPVFRTAHHQFADTAVENYVDDAPPVLELAGHVGDFYSRLV